MYEAVEPGLFRSRWALPCRTVHGDDGCMFFSQNQKVPEAVLKKVLRAFIAYHSSLIARGDIRSTGALDDDCVVVLEWLWRTDRARAVSVHTQLLQQISTKLKRANDTRQVKPDYLARRLEEGLNKLGLKSQGMAKGLAAGSNRLSHRRSSDSRRTSS
jgi:hypothetical protein